MGINENEGLVSDIDDAVDMDSEIVVDNDLAVDEQILDHEFGKCCLRTCLPSKAK